MGKPDSFFFCRMHDLKGVIENEKRVDVLLEAYMPDQLERFALLHPEYSQKDALLGCSRLLAIMDAPKKNKYIEQSEKYSNDPTKMISAIIDSGEEMTNIIYSDFPSERSGIYIAAYCCGLYGLKYVEMRNNACGWLDMILLLEEQGIDVSDDLAIWLALAYFVDFESWHDDKYGSPIIGKSPFYDKNADGSPLQKHNKNHRGQSFSGGCYVATAVYGSYNCPEVWTLRRYRDNSLSKSWFGRLSIHVYYAISPKLVDLFGDSMWFKRFWRRILDIIVKRLQNEGIEATYYEDKEW